MTAIINRRYLYYDCSPTREIEVSRGGVKSWQDLKATTVASLVAGAIAVRATKAALVAGAVVARATKATLVAGTIAVRATKAALVTRAVVARATIAALVAGAVVARATIAALVTGAVAVRATKAALVAGAVVVRATIAALVAGAVAFLVTRILSKLVRNLVHNVTGCKLLAFRSSNPNIPLPPVKLLSMSMMIGVNCQEHSLKIVSYMSPRCALHT